MYMDKLNLEIEKYSISEFKYEINYLKGKYYK